MDQIRSGSSCIVALTYGFPYDFNAKPLILKANSLSNYKVKLVKIAIGTTIDEISRALEILLKGKKITKDKIIILHCNTDYPTKIEDVNLRAIEEIKKNFGCN